MASLDDFRSGHASSVLPWHGVSWDDDGLFSCALLPPAHEADGRLNIRNYTDHSCMRFTAQICAINLIPREWHDLFSAVAAV
jgi:hypothetical protein